MDREARWATVHGVAELDTTLHLSSHAPPHRAPPPHLSPALTPICSSLPCVGQMFLQMLASPPVLTLGLSCRFRL